ncbi:MAG: hypothetical protein AAFQ94_22170 [Bacteroidota bacterium]
MLRISALITFLLIGIQLNAQIQYSGYIGSFPITLVSYRSQPGDIAAHYKYERYDDPIKLAGFFDDGKLRFRENDKNQKVRAILDFKGFSFKADSALGIWQDFKTCKEYQVLLCKEVDLSRGYDKKYLNKEIIQYGSTDDHYFKTVSSKEGGTSWGKVTAVKIFEKSTDRLVQVIPLDCEHVSYNSITIDDYNFDGVQDFAVFERSYAGPNTTSIYILRQPNSDKYVVSDIEGTSLHFSKYEKVIYEHNQCCGGRSHYNATYKIINNKMVLIQERCLSFDDELNDFVEVICD